MASTPLVTKSEKGQLVLWLESKGYRKIPKSKNIWEIFRMRSADDLIIVFQTKKHKHMLCFQEKDLQLIAEFKRWKKQKKAAKRKGVVNGKTKNQKDNNKSNSANSIPFETTSTDSEHIGGASSGQTNANSSNTGV